MLHRTHLEFNEIRVDYLINTSTRKEAIENSLRTFLKSDNQAALFLLCLDDTVMPFSVHVDEYPVIGEQPMNTNPFSNTRIKHKVFWLTKRTRHYGRFAIRTAKEILGENWKKKVKQLQQKIARQWHA